MAHISQHSTCSLIRKDICLQHTHISIEMTRFVCLLICSLAFEPENMASIYLFDKVLRSKKNKQLDISAVIFSLWSLEVHYLFLFWQ